MTLNTDSFFFFITHKGIVDTNVNIRILIFRYDSFAYVLFHEFFTVGLRHRIKASVQDFLIHEQYWKGINRKTHYRDNPNTAL